jgi:hypothetical protein
MRLEAVEPPPGDVSAEAPRMLLPIRVLGRSGMVTVADWRQARAGVDWGCC